MIVAELPSEINMCKKDTWHKGQKLKTLAGCGVWIVIRYLIFFSFGVICAVSTVD